MTRLNEPRLRLEELVDVLEEQPFTLPLSRAIDRVREAIVELHAHEEAARKAKIERLARAYEKQNGHQS